MKKHSHKDGHGDFVEVSADHFGQVVLSCRCEGRKSLFVFMPDDAIKLAGSILGTAMSQTRKEAGKGK